MKLIVPGFKPAELQHAIFFTRLMLPAQICFYEGSILTAVQYAKGQFVIPSLAPLIYNTAIILGGALLSRWIGITGFSVGVLCGALAGNFLLQIYGAYRSGAKFFPNFDVRHPGFWLFAKLSSAHHARPGTCIRGRLDHPLFRVVSPARLDYLAEIRKNVDAGAAGIGRARQSAWRRSPYLAQLYSEKNSKISTGY